MKNVSLYMSFFTIIILFSGSISPSLLIQESDAMVARGTMVHQTSSDKVCGDQLCSTINATPTPPKGQIIIPENEKQEDNPDASLLFVQTAGSGTFEDKDGKKILTFVDVSPTTVYFSDRPDRITGFMQTDLFVAVWGEGEDSFADDPPNAALELLDWDKQSDVFIIELLSATYNPEAEILQYEIIILEEATEGLSHYNKYNDPVIPATFEDSVLFIDNAVGDWFKDTAKDVGDGFKNLPGDVADGFKDATDYADNDMKSTSDELEGAMDYIKVKTIDPLTGKVVTVFTPVLKNSASLFCTVGKQIDGKVGCTVGNQLAISSVGTFLGAASRTDIGSALDPELVPIVLAIQKSLTSPTSNTAVALALTYNIFTDQGDNIKNDFLLFMHGFRDNPAMTNAYDADNFCGTSNDSYFENILYPFFYYNLQHELYYTILDDLNNGMSLSQVQSDLDANLDDKVRAVIVYSLVHIKVSCEGSDLYSLIYNSIDPAYRDNLVASTNDNGDTFLDSTAYPTLSQIALQQEINHLHNLRMQLIQEERGQCGIVGECWNKHISFETRDSITESADTVARARAQVNLEAQLVSERASFGIEEESVSEVSVSYDPFVDDGFNDATYEIESSISSEASSEIESLIEDSESYMSDFEIELINLDVESEELMDDIIEQMVEDAFEQVMDEVVEELAGEAVG